MEIVYTIRRAHRHPHTAKVVVLGDARDGSLRLGLGLIAHVVRGGEPACPERSRREGVEVAGGGRVGGIPEVGSYVPSDSSGHHTGPAVTEVQDGPARRTAPHTPALRTQV